MDKMNKDEEFVDSIPVPEDDEVKKGHKVVRYVNVPENYDEEDEISFDDEKKKKGFVADFFSGVAAGAKTLGENIKAGSESQSHSSHDEDDDISFEAETEDEDDNEDEYEYEEDERPSFKDKISGFFGNLSSKTIIIGAAIVTALIIGIILLSVSSCSKEPGNDNPVGPINPNTPIVTPDDTTGTDIEEDIPLEIPERSENYTEALKLNNDVVGWLYIPGLSDVDAGICQDRKSYSYNKRDITGKNVSANYWIKGAYYSHLRNRFGESLDDLSQNTVIFGHSDLGLTHLAYSNDDPTGPLFSQLFNFKNPEFAANTPYIYLTTAAGDSVWEVFSVFYNDSNIDGGKALWYIEPEPGNAFGTVLETMKDRSLYDYEVEVGNEDKILTLSTCTVGFGLSNRARYRFVIVAKLVRDTDNLIVKKANFQINEDAPIPETYKDEFSEYIKTWNTASAEE